jgi:hypothetical protein
MTQRRVTRRLGRSKVVADIWRSKMPKENWVGGLNTRFDRTTNWVGEINMAESMRWTER